MGTPAEERLARINGRRQMSLTEASQRVEVLELDVTQLTAHPDNLRETMGDVTEMALSIEQFGVIEPVIVVPHESHFRIIAGHRRVAASIRAGRSTVPVIVRADLAGDQSAQRVAILIENVMRDDLSLTEQAKGFALFADEGLTQREIAGRVGCSQSHISRALAALNGKAPAEPKPPTPARLERQLRSWLGDGDVASVTTWIINYPEAVEKAARAFLADQEPSEAPEVTIEHKGKSYSVRCSKCGFSGRNSTLEYAEERKADHLWEKHGVKWDPDEAFHEDKQDPVAEVLG